jgi:dolichyl-phosphate-mannose-protein mannosyltransferase
LKTIARPRERAPVDDEPAGRSRPSGSPAVIALEVPAPEKNRHLLPVLLLLGLSLVSRLCFLGYPAEVVFDETGFGKRVNAYGWSGQRLFDIHPPHGKLLITGVAKFAGYHGTIDFSKIGIPCAESIVPLRLLPAFAGALIPLLVLIVLRQLGASFLAASTGAILITLDNAFIVQSRVTGLDSLLVFLMLSTISVTLAARRSSGLRRFSLLLAAGSLCGLCVGTKFTGLAAFALALIIVGTTEGKRRGRALRIGIDTAVFCGASAMLYAIGWLIHFRLMTAPTSDDAFFVPKGNFWSDTVRLHEVMLSANAGLKATHSYASYWWQWLLMKKPIYYWVHGDAGIYFIGNPLVWWSVNAAFLALIGHLVFGRARHFHAVLANDRASMLWIPIAAVFISIFPLIPVSRPLFMYHYLPTLAFATIAVMLWLDQLMLERLRPLFRGWYIAGLGCYLAAFLAMTPLTYGLGWLKSCHAVMKWTRFGP